MSFTRTNDLIKVNVVDDIVESLKIIHICPDYSLVKFIRRYPRVEGKVRKIHLHDLDDTPRVFLLTRTHVQVPKCVPHLNLDLKTPLLGVLLFFT